MEKLVMFVAIIGSVFQSQKVLSQHPQFKVLGDSIKVYNAFTFSPDGRKMFTSEPHRIKNPDGGGLLLPRWGSRNRPWVTLYQYDLDDNSLPINRNKLPFANDSLDSSPHINFSGDRIYFNSRRPIPGSTELDGVMHVWYSEKDASGNWSDPKYFEEINRKNYYSSYAQELGDGSVMFQSNIPGSVDDGQGKPSQDLWMSIQKDGRYQPPVNVENLNSTIHEDQLVINRNGDLIIFTRYDEKEMYLFYSTKKIGEWTEPVELFITDQGGFKEQSPRLTIDESNFCFAHGLLVMCAPLEELLKMNSKY